MKRLVVVRIRASPAGSVLFYRLARQDAKKDQGEKSCQQARSFFSASLRTRTEGFMRRVVETPVASSSSSRTLPSSCTARSAYQKSTRFEHRAAMARPLQRSASVRAHQPRRVVYLRLRPLRQVNVRSGNRTFEPSRALCRRWQAEPIL